MFAVLVFWLSLAFKFFVYVILIIVTMNDNHTTIPKETIFAFYERRHDVNSLCFVTQDEIIALEF